MFSEQLKADINNLMLLCDKHHRLIDIEDVDGHPVARLQQMKRKHEDRIELLTSITSDKRSHVVLYGAISASTQRLLVGGRQQKLWCPSSIPQRRGRSS